MKQSCGDQEYLFIDPGKWLEKTRAAIKETALLWVSSLQARALFWKYLRHSRKSTIDVIGKCIFAFPPRQNPQCYQKLSIFSLHNSTVRNEHIISAGICSIWNCDGWRIYELLNTSNFSKDISFKLVPCLISQLLPIREVVCLLFPLQGVCLRMAKSRYFYLHGACHYSSKLSPWGTQLKSDL